MFDWLVNNIGTILISICLLIIISLIIYKIIRDKKSGKSSCGCNCSNCALHHKCCHK